jgi:hypothetical protein
MYEHAVNGELLTVLPDTPDEGPGPTLSDKNAPNTARGATGRQ